MPAPDHPEEEAVPPPVEPSTDSDPLTDEAHEAEPEEVVFGAGIELADVPPPEPDPPAVEERAEPAEVKKHLHIGIVAQGWKPDVGGIESHTADLVRELLELGHRVSVLALDYTRLADNYGMTHDVVDGVHVSRMSYDYGDHRALAQMVRNRAAEDVVATWLKMRQPDIVHVHHLTGFGMGALARMRGEGVPTVMTLHDYWALCPRGQMVRFATKPLAGEVCGGLNPDVCGRCIGASFPHLMPSHGALMTSPWDGDSEDAPVLSVLEGQDPDGLVAAHRTAYAIECLKCADLLVTPSNRTRQIFTEICAPMGLDGGQIRVVENGVDVAGLAEEVARIRAEKPRGGPRVLGIVGSVLPSKGVLEVAMAFAEGQGLGRFRGGGGLKLEIHGNMPSYHGQTGYIDALEVLAAATPNLTLAGPFEHGGLAEVLAGLDAVAAPSRWQEVFGLTVREARAAGLPVIVSNVGDLPAVTDGGKAGLVMPAPNGASGRSMWIDAMQRLIEDHESREAWASHARPPHSAAAMAAELAGLYCEVLQGRLPQAADLAPDPSEALGEA